MRGTGLYNTSNCNYEPLSEAIYTLILNEVRPTKPLYSIPIFNFFEIRNLVLKKAILNDALPNNKSRIINYGTNCYYNVALVSVPSSTGKTTTLNTLMLGSLNYSGSRKVYGSGPTNTAITNFVLRIYARGYTVAEKYNKDIPSSNIATPQYRYPLIVRRYSNKIKLNTFKNILKTKVADDTTYKSPNPNDTPH